jgi:methyltransferase family protein
MRIERPTSIAKSLMKRAIRRLLSAPACLQQAQWVPPGHFFSPIPSIKEVREREHQLFHEHPVSIPGIQLKAEQQLELLEIFKGYYSEQPFSDRPTPQRRYYFENEYYSYSDAICFYCMIRYLKPKRIIEIGSGYSSAAMLDINEVFFSDSIACTFIEPYPERLYALLRDADRRRVEILVRKVQDVDLTIFAALKSQDILVVDSSHVAKIGSDVNHIFFTILPYLNSGVYIHFHDIQYGFEYPKEWIYEGRAWNEAYMLRAFLQYNDAFQIVFFNTFLEHFYEDYFAQHMPLCLKNLGGSIWLRKT